MILGIDAHAIYDCELSEEKILSLPSILNQREEEFKNICARKLTLTESGQVYKWEEDGVIVYEVAGEWGFGIYIADQRIRFWHSSRWKFVLRHEGYHHDEYFKVAKFIGQLLEAKRILYLSDYLEGQFEENTPFEVIKKTLGKPSDPSQRYEIKEGYWNIFFYEELNCRKQIWFENRAAK